MNCTVCGEQQYSLMDRNYLKLFPQCWSCDKNEWSAGRLSLEEFEKRELRALEYTDKYENSI